MINYLNNINNDNVLLMLNIYEEQTLCEFYTSHDPSIIIIQLKRENNYICK
jgi:hypothetical protein